MSFEGMLNHRCDIYHLIKTEASPGFGLPASPSFSYPETPDAAGAACHFGVKGSTAVTVSQQAPFAVYEARIKLALPIGTDIRLNDKVIDRSNGIEYTADVPTQIRNHHIVVMLRRTDAQQPIGAPHGQS